MVSSRWQFFLCSIVIHLVALRSIRAQQKILEHFCLSEQGNFSTCSTYQKNLKHQIFSLSSQKKIDHGFYTGSSGKDPDIVNAMALCRGDVQSCSCRRCIAKSTVELPKLCPNQKEAVIWYDYCMFRYSSRYFFGNMEFGPYFWMYSLNNVSEPNQFNRTLITLLDSLKKKAASGGCLRKFAVGNATTPSSETIYGLVQCTPDLSKQQCTDCLSKATALIPNCCSGRQGGRVISPSCNFRYEKYIFYDPTVAAPTPT